MCVCARSRFYRRQMVKMCGCKPKVYTCDELKILLIKLKPCTNSKADSLMNSTNILQNVRFYPVKGLLDWVVSYKLLKAFEVLDRKLCINWGEVDFELASPKIWSQKCIKMDKIKLFFIVFVTLLDLSWALPKGCAMEIIVDPHFHQFYSEKYPQK